MSFVKSSLEFNYNSIIFIKIFLKNFGKTKNITTL